MADAVTTIVIANNKKEYVVHLTNISDGTGESAVKKVNIATLIAAATGVAPTSLAIERARWAIQGMTLVKILWDHTTDDVALLLPAGSGYDDFHGGPGSLRDFVDGTGGLIDPGSSGGDGSILLTTVGAVSGGTYDITLWFRLVP